MKPIKTIFFFCLITLLAKETVAQESILRAGTWYKLAITKNGVYKIDYNYLKKIGINVNKINPRQIKIYGNGGGMLPQANSALRAADLIENAIAVVGEDDGQFNAQDFILFYAQGPDKSSFDSKKDIFYYEKNIYDDYNYYFLTVADNDGKRLTYNQNLADKPSTVSVFDDYLYHEQDLFNVLKSGREWFGESVYSDLTFKFDLSGITSNSTLKLVSNVMAQAYNAGSTFKTAFNNVAIGEQFVAPIPDPAYFPYATKGLQTCDTLLFNSNTVLAASRTQQVLNYQYIKNSSYALGYINYFLISFKRKLALYGDQTLFLSSASLQNNESTFEIDQVNDGCTVWEITNPLAPQWQPCSIASGQARFTVATNTLREFIVFNTNYNTPTFVGTVTNQNLHNLSTPNLVIITHPEFISAAKQLANHRESYNSITTAVVTTNEIFNEFSSGRKDVCAIRDFTRHLYGKNPGQLQAILLFGRCSYDYKSRLNNNTNFVLTYESRNSLDPLETYSSDDFFGLLDENEGDWGEDPAEDNTLDVGIGRLPVKTNEEALHVVEKIIDYDTNTAKFNSWQKEITFIADDGDNNIHQSQSDKLAQKVESTHPEFNTQRIFLDAFTQNLTPGGEFSPNTNKAIQDALTKGSVIINYTGHGAERIWAQEKIFDEVVISNLDNKVYPLFVTATCEFGRNDDPAIISGAELCVIKKQSGAIGMVTTTRPVNSSTNFELNNAFYDALFVRESGSFLTLGEIFKRTKNNSISGISNRNFSLLGDPSMSLAMPKLGIKVQSIENEQGTDTLKALSTIVVRGEILNTNGTKAENFSGLLSATLFDKKNTFTTLGNENPPFTYKQWYNALFRGSATVLNGNFEFNFLMPKNIAYQVGQGQLSLYAASDTGYNSATGFSTDLLVGRSNPFPAIDTTPPTINLFMGDETFVNGGLTKSDTYLVATLHDASGINISGYSIGNSIIATLDDAEPIILNDYYAANANDFTSGKIIYRLKGLLPGKHTITLKAWDSYNNPSQASVSFTVSDGNALKIEKFGNYPNPFSDKTTLYFTHNSAGEDLAGSIEIYDLSGQLVKSSNFSVTSSNYTVELDEINTNLDFNKKLQAGLYLAKLIVRSVVSSSKTERVTKLIVLN